jgi:Right handed beta helix region
MKRAILATALLTLAFALPAHAQNGTLTRSFVSSTGLDGNPCTITQPCATFAVAYTKISANGIIAALDPGKYGPLTIIGPVTVNGNGWAAITGTSGGAAITVTASSGTITLIGLELDGANASQNGINLTSTVSASTSLNVRDCVVSNFTGDGIAIQPEGTYPLKMLITNTTSLNNGGNGLTVAPSEIGVFGVITGATIANNTANGIELEHSSYITVLNSVVSTNGNNGIYVLGGQAIIRDTTATENSNFDFASNGALSYLYRDTFGVLNIGSGTVYSDGTSDVAESGPPTPTKQNPY